MRKLLFISACLSTLAIPAYAKNRTASITSDQVVEIAKILRGREETDMYRACVNAYGSFGGGTITYKLSTDDGTTKVDMKNLSGTVDTSTADDAFCFKWGWGTGLNDDTLFYASMSGSTTPSVTIDVYDNR